MPLRPDNKLTMAGVQVDIHKMAVVQLVIKALEKVLDRHQVQVHQVLTITNAIQPVRILKNIVHQQLVVSVAIMNNNNIVQEVEQIKELIVVMVNLNMVVKVVVIIQVICIFVVVKVVFVDKPFVYQINRVRYDKSDIECLPQNQTFLNVFIFVVNQVKL
jgi:hypothetical protein